MDNWHLSLIKEGWVNQGNRGGSTNGSAPRNHLVAAVSDDEIQSALLLELEDLGENELAGSDRHSHLDEVLRFEQEEGIIGNLLSC